MVGEPPQELHIDREFMQAQAGICPNTGEACEKLRGLYLISKASADSFAMGFGDGSFTSMTAGQREAYERKLQEDLRRGELLGRAIAGPCVEACVLDDVDVSAYIQANAPSQEEH